MRNLIATCLLFITSVVLNAASWEVTVKVEPSADNKNFTIIVEAVNIPSPLTFSLYDGQPATGGKKLMEYTSVSTNLKTFVVSSPGKYLVGVTDLQGNCRFVPVQVK